MKTRTNVILGMLLLVLGYLVFDSGGRTVLGVSLVMLAVLPISLQFYLNTQDRVRLKHPIMLYLPVVLVIILLISSALSKFHYQSLVYSLYFLGLILIYLIVSQVKWQRRHLNLILIIIFALSVVESLIAIFNYLASNLPPEFIRMSGTFYWPNQLAAFLLVGIPIGLYFFWSSNRFKYLYLLSVSILFSTFILTYSKGAYLSLIPAILVLVWQFRSEIRKSWFIKAFSLVVLTIVITTGLSLARQNSFKLTASSLQSSTDGNASSLTRFSYWQGALNIMSDHKLIGSGPATFGDVYQRYQKSTVEYAKNAHDFYLEMLAETGIFGFLTIIIFSLLLILLPIKRGVLKSRGFGLVVSLALLGLLIHSTIDVDFSYPALIFLFWLLAGLLVGSLGSTNLKIQKSNSNWLIMPAIGLLLFIFAVFNYLSNVRYNQAKDIVATGDYTAAAEEFSASLMFLNHNPRAIYYLAQIDYQKYDLTKAASEINQAIDQYPEAASFYYIKGAIMEAEGNNQLATSAYQKSIELDPWNNPDYYLALSELYLKTGQKQKSADLLQPYLAKFNNQVFSTLNLNKDLPGQIGRLRELLKESTN